MHRSTLKVLLGFGALAVTILSATPSQAYAYGPDTCIRGLVWRDAYPDDHVCVRPWVRAQAASDNAAARQRSFWNGQCRRGLVWRQADPGDHVCVVPAIRALTAAQNARAFFGFQRNAPGPEDRSGARETSPPPVGSAEPSAAAGRNPGDGAGGGRRPVDFDPPRPVDPVTAQAYWRRGQSKAAQGRPDRAIEDFNLALRFDPGLDAVYADRGLAFEAKGDLIAGLRNLHKALERAPGDAKIAAAIDRVGRQLAGAPPDAVTGSLPPPPEPAAEAAVALPPPPAPEPVAFSPPPPAPGALRPAPAKPERRIALVIGNAHYASAGLLANPLNDAHELAKTLRAAGFDVTTKDDLSREGLVDALAAFADAATSADWAVVYFSGHGIEMAGANYLVPVDAKLLTDTSVGFEAVPLGQVMAAVEGAHKLRLVILDACRSNPFADRMPRVAAARSPSRGLVRPPEPDPGELVVYAAKEGEVASDGEAGHSPFSQALLQEIRSAPVDVRRLFDRVRDDVIEATGGKQHPFTYGSLSGRADFLFQTQP